MKVSALTIALVLLAGPVGAQTIGTTKTCLYQVHPGGNVVFYPGCPPEDMDSIQAEEKAKAPATQANIAELRAAIERLTSLMERDQDSHAK